MSYYPVESAWAEIGALKERIRDEQEQRKRAEGEIKLIWRALHSLIDELNEMRGEPVQINGIKYVVDE